MFLSILFGSVIVGLAFAYTTLAGYWWLVPTVAVALAIPTAYIVARWPYWWADRQARAGTIEFDFTGLKLGQRTYYEAVLDRTDPRDRKRLLSLYKSMEAVKRTNVVR
jgi:hypothetical protein